MIFSFLVSENRVGIGPRIDGRRVNGGEPMPVSADKALGRLEELAASQIQLQRQGAFQDFLEHPLSHFSSSFLAQDLHRQSADEVFGVKNLQEYTERLQGKVFELLAYATLSAWQPDNRAVLSPRDTVDFFQTLYPRHRRIDIPGGHGTIGGVYVPDGLVVEMRKDGPQILKVLEYTKNVDAKIKEGEVERRIVAQTLGNPALDGADLALVFPTKKIPQDTLNKLGDMTCYMFPFNVADFEIVAGVEIERIVENREPATAEDIRHRTLYEALHLERVIDGIPEMPWTPWMAYANELPELLEE